MLVYSCTHFSQFVWLTLCRFGIWGRMTFCTDYEVIQTRWLDFNSVPTDLIFCQTPWITQVRYILRPSVKISLFGIATWGFLDQGGSFFFHLLNLKFNYQKLVKNKNVHIKKVCLYFAHKILSTGEVFQWGGWQFQTNNNFILAKSLVLASGFNEKTILQALIHNICTWFWLNSK